MTDPKRPQRAGRAKAVKDDLPGPLAAGTLDMNVEFDIADLQAAADYPPRRTILDDFNAVAFKESRATGQDLGPLFGGEYLIGGGRAGGYVF